MDERAKGLNGEGDEDLEGGEVTPQTLITRVDYQNKTELMCLSKIQRNTRNVQCS